MNNTRQPGFTLIEVLVALAIFALMSVMAYQALGQSLDNADLLGKRMDRLESIQRTMNLLGRDITQAAPRPVRDPFDDSLRPAFSVRPGTEFALEVTHNGWPNPAGLPRSTQQRVAYRIEDGALIRLNWNVLDPAISSEPNATTLLDDVEGIYFRFFLGNGQWTEQWPPQGAGGLAGMRMRPSLVEVVLTLNDTGELQRFFEVAK
ncbi:MAG TPA: type II secretion system minor pseudopilin GspJ [Woeseiaceae bacterium]|nr:type II secretion system minor pseudopilin GspJ [Woeseiaceae bacterium]